MKNACVLLMIVSTLFISCSTTKSTTTSAKTMDIYGEGVIHKPVIVDLDVKEVKVTGTVVFDAGSQIDIVKQAAVSDALKKAGADVLVEPAFFIETTNEKITCTVIGFPATYKNFRPIKLEDVPLLKVGITQKAQVFEPTATVGATKKKSKVGLIAGAVILAGAVVAGIASGGL